MNKSKHKFTFIDLCAGIGGFHVALSNLGGKCIYAAEIDKDALFTYKQKFWNECIARCKRYGNHRCFACV